VVFQINSSKQELQNRCKNYLVLPKTTTGVSCTCYKLTRKGKLGLESAVAQLVQKEQNINASKTYAELWMGTHPSGPSQITKGDQKEKLSEYLRDQVQKNGVATVFGANVAKEFPKTENGDIPFLFKILSVNQALSIQAHPDLTRAKELHQGFPQHYKDDNHKPELTIALTR
jgi:mannose-6-phosphate isomerase